MTIYLNLTCQLLCFFLKLASINDRFRKSAVIPAPAYRMDTINYKDSFPALCRGGKVLWGANYPKRFVNPAMWLLTIPRSSKKQRQLFCLFLLNESLSDIFTKPLRFRFGSASCPIVQLFF
jgi:hypothetical protein